MVGVGIWVRHDMTLTVKKHDRENGSILGVCLVVLGLWWGPVGSGVGGLPLPDVDELV